MTISIRRRAVLAALVLPLASASVQAGETRLAVGALAFAPGLDLHLTWRAEESRWLYWEQREKSLRTGTSGEDSAVAPFFGAGYVQLQLGVGF